ncbi:acetyltransferase [Methylobacterium frigidaeris]|uniref:Acetyltransferase EpsM n=1 Tax=Methylobacterium frigidaeris TaxID=2038277 RepID=A0AA37HDS1_9HYPH|nr:acetyltransferase [Methylobacterium frigidaeris]PIK74552.1 sugar O-acyltransferase [Methylobacterium frigidaeris]GJD63944.1 Putative acetyltransferase EpsM [Methylobacterium frigidaeris]
MQRPLIILGTGGNALDILDLVESRSGPWRVAGFLDDARPAGDTVAGLPVLGRLGEARLFAEDPETGFVNAIGSEASHRERLAIVARTGLDSERFATLVHAGAAVSSRAVLGPGTCVHAGASVAGNVVVGLHVAIGPGTIVGHDTVIEDGAVLAPGCIVSGFVRLGRTCYVGAGSALRQRVAIGDRALIGLGAVVLRDVPAGATVVGNPARTLRMGA